MFTLQNLDYLRMLTVDINEKEKRHFKTRTKDGPFTSHIVTLTPLPGITQTSIKQVVREG